MDFVREIPANQNESLWKFPGHGKCSHKHKKKKLSGRSDEYTMFIYLFIYFFVKHSSDVTRMFLKTYLICYLKSSQNVLLSCGNGPVVTFVATP